MPIFVIVKDILEKKIEIKKLKLDMKTFCKRNILERSK